MSNEPREQFQASEVQKQAPPAVPTIAAQPSRRSSEILGQGRQPAIARPSSRLGLFNASWLCPAAVALTGILLIVGVGMEIRKSAGLALPSVNRSGEEALGVPALTVVAPGGDLSEAPREMQWKPVRGATKYRVQLLEADRSPLWHVETTGTRVPLPAAVRDRMVPGKTILGEVVAMDAAGTKIADSEMVRFRVAPKVH